MEILTLIGAIGSLLTAVGAGYAYAMVRLNKQIAELEYENHKLDAALDHYADEYADLATRYASKISANADTEGELESMRKLAEDHRYAYSKQQAELMFWRGKVQLMIGDEEAQRLRDEWSMLYRYEGTSNTTSSLNEYD